MGETHPTPFNRAAYRTASLFGVFAGLGGLMHAIGEILQGPVAPAGLIFNSWAQGPIALYLGGEPAMSVIPNLLVTGIANLIVSLAVIVWAAAFVQRRRGGLVLLALVLAMLLVGGGFGPPIVGILAAVAGMGIHAPYTWWRERAPEGVIRTMARLWPVVFALCVLNGFFLFVGMEAIIYLFRVDMADLGVASFFFAVVSLALTVLTGIGYDVQRVPVRRMA